MVPQEETVRIEILLAGNLTDLLPARFQARNRSSSSLWQAFWAHSPHALYRERNSYERFASSRG